MIFLNFKKVLCISAHPDDAEYGMLPLVNLEGQSVKIYGLI